MTLLEPQEQRNVARFHGIQIPGVAWNASEEAGVPFSVICAFLTQESGGGANIYGHDVDTIELPDGTVRTTPRPFWGHGQVTETNYAAYLVERDLGVREKRWEHLGHRSQGVGPMQLTFWTIQDEADREGGCWNPRTNILTGARILKRHRETGKSWWQTALAYNGKESYANEMLDRIQQWRRLMNPR
jgi:hypothetical protein